MVKDPFVAPSAHRHGVAAKDATHAWRNAIRSFDVEEDMVLLIGPDEAGRLLEIGVVSSRQHPGAVIVHAMPARARFLEG